MVARCIIILIMLGGIYAVYIVGTIVSAKADAEYPFSCPNCGEKFELDWKQLIPSNLVKTHPNYRRAKCPICQKKDLLKIYREW